MSSEIANSALLQDIKAILEQARAQVKQTVNSAMVQAYWKIGQLIVRATRQPTRRIWQGGVAGFIETAKRRIWQRL